MADELATGEYDYDGFHAEGDDNYLVPLEVVFRNAVPPGSSLRSRFEPSEVGVDADDGIAGPDDLVEHGLSFLRQHVLDGTLVAKLIRGDKRLVVTRLRIREHVAPGVEDGDL